MTQISLAHGLALAGIVPPTVTPLRPAPACDTLGHEYHFGICLDCDQPQPDYEPTDGQIPGTYEIRQAAA